MERKIFNIVKKLCGIVFPRAIYLFVGKQYYRMRELIQRKKIIKYIRNENDPKKTEICEFLVKNKMQPFPYFFTLEHSPKNITVYQSSDCEAKYILYLGKKMFFKKTWDDEKIRKYVNELFIEQDKRSAHCYYLYDNCVPFHGEVIADIGAAEGIWALSYVEIAKKIYLFECDPEWKEALELTFAPWKDKVEIVPEYVGKNDAVGSISLDSFFSAKHVDCIKADIEGAEEDMLQGGRSTFCNKISKAIICVYHNYDDESKFQEYLREYGFGVFRLTDGFMLYDFWKTFENSSAYIRRGVLLARK